MFAMNFLCDEQMFAAKSEWELRTVQPKFQIYFTKKQESNNKINMGLKQPAMLPKFQICAKLLHKITKKKKKTKKNTNYLPSTYWSKLINRWATQIKGLEEIKKSSTKTLYRETPLNERTKDVASELTTRLMHNIESTKPSNGKYYAIIID